MRSTHSPSLRSRYDYYHASPLSSQTTNVSSYYDNQNASLFGDPVPPSTGFLENLDNHLYDNLRNFERNKSSAQTSNDLSSNGYYSASLRDPITTAALRSESYIGSSRRLSIDTQSSDNRLYTSNLRSNNPDNHVYNHFRRPSSALSNDFRTNLEYFRNQQEYNPYSVPSDKPTRVLSSESSYYNPRTRKRANESTEWYNYKSALDDWSNIPRPQHLHSKNITQVNHSSTLSDSRSSSDERSTIASIPKPNFLKNNSSYSVNTYSVLPFKSNLNKVNNNLSELREDSGDVEDDDENYNEMDIQTRDGQEIKTQSGGESSTPSYSDKEITIVQKVEPSPVIITDTITTGSNHRLQPPGRQHHKSSFAIINELSPHTSRAPSPTPSNSGRTSPFLGHGFKSSRSHLARHNSFESLQQENRATVHFSNSLIAQPRSRSSLSLQPRSILQNKKPILRERYEFETDRIINNKSLIPTRSSSLSRAANTTSAVLLASTPSKLKRRNSYSTTSYGYQKKSFEMLPFVTQIPRNVNLSSRTKHTQTHPGLFRSKTLILDESLETTNSKPPINPRSHHKGVMKVVQSTQTSPSKIPTRKESLLVSSENLINIGKPSRKMSVGSRNMKASEKPNASPKPIKRDKQSKDENSKLNKESDSKEKSDKARTEKPAKKIVNSKKPLTRTGSITSNKSNKSNKSIKAAIAKKLTPSTGTQKAAALIASKFTRTKKSTTVKTDTALSSAAAEKKVSDITNKEVNKKTEEVTPISPSKIPVRQPSNPKIELKSQSPIKIVPPPAPKSPTKSMLSVSIKKGFGFSSVSKALTRSFRRKKIEGESGTDTDSLVSGSTLSLLKQTDSSASIVNPLHKVESSSSIKNLKDATTVKPETATSVKETPKLLRKDSTNSKKESVVKKQTSNLSQKLKDIDQAKAENENERQLNMSKDKLIPLTKSNVVSMTTAAITSQPVQISTTVTNQISQIKESDYVDNYSANIPTDSLKSNIEKSQKVLENAQKTVKEAASEIQKTIDENLSNLKSLEKEVNKASILSEQMNSNSNSNNKANTTTSSTNKVNLKQEPKSSGTTEVKNPILVSIPQQPISKTTVLLQPPSASNSQIQHPIETTVSVLNEKIQQKANNNNNQTKNQSNNGENSQKNKDHGLPLSKSNREINNPTNKRIHDNSVNKKSNSEDSNNNNNNNPKTKSDDKFLQKTNSDVTMKLGGNNEGDSVIEDEDDLMCADDLDTDVDDLTSSSRTCCSKRCQCCSPVCSKLCIPCNSLFKFCRRKKQPTTKTDEKQKDNGEQKVGCCYNCLKKINCCARGKDKEKQEKETKMKSSSRPPRSESNEIDQPENIENVKRRTCFEIFCCKSKPKMDVTETEPVKPKKCCFCIPCSRKDATQPKVEGASIAWSNRRESIHGEEKKSCCSRFWNKLLCCKKSEPQVNGSRRTSKNSKTQSIAPTLPSEDSREKLDLALVEHTSMMKAAIPVLPICLAWFCGIWNFIIPGLGTILSGLFCLCLGIPRFSQRDTARARIGSFIINLIIGILQAFCLLFCLVGYGWSAWWGVIMIKTARKHKRIKVAENVEEPTVLNNSLQPPVVAQNHSDVEAGR